LPAVECDASTLNLPAALCCFHPQGPVLVDLPKDITASVLTQMPRAPTMNQQRHAAATFGGGEKRASSSTLGA